MSPRWLHWPSVSTPAFDLTISGTTDTGDGTGYGSVDNDPASSPTLTGLSSVTMRGSGGGTQRLFFTFDTSGNRDSFKAAYPAGSYVSFTADGTEMTGTINSWNSFGTLAMLQADDFSDAFAANYPSGTVYTVGFNAP